MAITVEQLARVLTEELERDSWGDIDPSWIRYAAEPEEAFGETEREYSADMRAVLDRVVARLGEGAPGLPELLKQIEERNAVSMSCGVCGSVLPHHGDDCAFARLNEGKS